MPTQRVAIIGAGVHGICAAKNLLELDQMGEEARFDVDILESRRDGFGGVWRLSDDPKVLTATKTTVLNISIWRNCFSDFSVAEAFQMARERGLYEDTSYVGNDQGPRRRVDGVPAFLSAEEFLLYLQMYGEKFDILRHIYYGWKVEKIVWNEDDRKWAVRRASSEIAEYDKVILATGQWNTPRSPQIAGLEAFKGRVLHSIAFKRPEEFVGQRVLIVGFSNTAGDTSASLKGHASAIYISHRRGNHIFPRIVDGNPLDVKFTRRIAAIRNFFTSFAPIYAVQAFDRALDGITKQAAGGKIDPEWRVLPAPSASVAYPMVTEGFFENLRSGAVTLVPEVISVSSDGSTVSFADGQTQQFDAIIFCTGYDSQNTVDLPIVYSGTPALPCMYMNIFHPDHPTTFATTTMWETPTGICEGADLVCMAIAQVFAGLYKLPTKADMEAEIEIFHNRNRALAPLGFGETTADSRNAKSIMNNEGPWRWFLNEAAGTGLNERLGWGLKGWWFWLRNFGLCNMLMTGVDHPAISRLYVDKRDTGRTAWRHAEEEITKANKQIGDYIRMEKQGQKGKH